MHKIWKPLVFVLIPSVLLAGVFLEYKASAKNRLSQESQLPGEIAGRVGTSKGDLAPNFTGITLDGQSVRLSDLRGKTILINAFASWCGPCRIEAPHLVEAFSEVKDDDIVFIGLNLMETPEAVAQFKDDFAINYPLVLNQDGHLTDLYHPIGLPTSWFIDPDGVVRYVHTGAITKDLLLRAIEDTKAGRQFDPFAPSS